MKLSGAQESALIKVKDYYRRADNHMSIKTFRKECRENFGFYDGTMQWPDHIKKILESRGQDIVTVNYIKNLVNYMSGVEIQTRFRTACRSHSNKEQDVLLAKALTNVMYYEQEANDIPHQQSMKYKDCLITGIGWSNIFRHQGRLFYEYVNPYNVLPDPDDLSPEFNEMDYVIRLRWFTKEKAKNFWPEHSRYFDRVLSESNMYTSGNYDIYGELSARQSDEFYSSENSVSGSRIKIVEVQHKISKMSYCGYDYSGNYFETFNEEEAEEMSPSNKDIEEKKATQVMRTLFTDEMLLEHSPLEPNIPNLPDFTYVPALWSRRFNDGVPEGWLSGMKDTQREINYRKAKITNNLSSFRVIADANAFPGYTEQEIAQLVSRPDAVLIKNPGTDLIIESNMPMASGQFEMLERNDKDLQRISGIYSDALGEPTNASSGVAIQHRQVNSVRNQVSSFDNFKNMKKREGRMFLAYMQGSGDEFIEASISDDSGSDSEIILLNMVRDVGGKKVVFNDVRTLPVSIYIEEVPDNESSFEEQKMEMQTLLSNPNAMDIMQSPLLLKRYGIRDYEELAQEVQQVAQQKAQMEVMGNQGKPQSQQSFNPIDPVAGVGI